MDGASRGVPSPARAFGDLRGRALGAAPGCPRHARGPRRSRRRVRALGVAPRLGHERTGRRGRGRTRAQRRGADAQGRYAGAAALLSRSAELSGDRATQVRRQLDRGPRLPRRRGCEARQRVAPRRRAGGRHTHAPRPRAATADRDQFVCRPECHSQGAPGCGPHVGGTRRSPGARHLRRSTRVVPRLGSADGRDDAGRGRAGTLHSRRLPRRRNQTVRC